MREYSTPLEAGPEQAGNLADAVVRNAERSPERVVIADLRAGRPGERWTQITAARFHDDVRRLAAGLVAAGVEAGDRVLLLSTSRYEWTLVDYALWYVGAVSVPAYPSSSPDQLQWMLADSGARFAVVETTEMAQRLNQRVNQRVNPRGNEAADQDPPRTWVIEEAGESGLSGLTALGDHVDEAEVERRRADVGADHPATVLYTSGTTGPPRGCVLTHGNFAAELAGASSALRELFEEEDATTLMVLPLAHVFARILQVAAISNGVRLGHVSDVRRLVDAIEEFEPTFLLGVPRVFERVFNTLSQRAASEGRGRRFDRAIDVAIRYSEALDQGGPSPVLRARHRTADRLVYSRLRASLGGRCRYLISGGAPLGDRISHFYRGIGIPVLEGYGLSETTGATTVNVPDALRVGSAGQPLPGAALRVQDDGELLVRGPHVMRGYWNTPEATAEVLGEDGWLHTGDLAEIDAEGFVWITGRKKELLVTAGGKNVSPAVLEQRVQAHRLVGHCMAVGDGRPYVAAVVTLDREMVAQWAEQHGKTASVSRLVDDPELRAEIQTAVDSANSAVSQAESIRRFAVLAEEWSEETGELTATLKVRRQVVLRRYREDIEELYPD